MRSTRAVVLVAVLAVCASGCVYVAPVSVSSSGAVGNAASSEPALSLDGRYVAFTSSASSERMRRSGPEARIARITTIGKKNRQTMIARDRQGAPQ